MVRRVGNAATGQPDLYTTNVYDTVGRQIAQTTFADGLFLTTSNVYDSAGRQIATSDAAGLVTTYAYPNPLTSVTISSGLLTNTTVRYPDGRARYTEQNGIRQTTYSYGPHSPSAPPPVTPQTARYHAPRVRPDPKRTGSSYTCHVRTQRPFASLRAAPPPTVANRLRFFRILRLHVVPASVKLLLYFFNHLERPNGSQFQGVLDELLLFLPPRFRKAGFRAPDV